jgi:2-keto-3-deoxy-L-rhamnonate aldolase RhmA
MGRIAAFRTRLRSKAPLAGTFIKTPSPILCEVLGASRLDVLCLDAEHAPFDRLALDGCVAALRAADMPSLVRTPSAAPEHILSVLDMGASGVVLPHIRSAKEAAAAVAASRYGRGGGDWPRRGYAGSSRAAGYGTRAISDHLAAAADIAVILQIEDVEALNELDAIAAVEGVDALFIGRIDLTVALGETSPFANPVLRACETIASAGRAADVAVGTFTPDLKEVGAGVSAA